MTELYPSLILDALRTVRYPGTGKDIVTMGMVEDDIRIDGNRVSFSLIFPKKTDPFIKSIVKASEVAINTYISPEVEIKGNISVKTPDPEAKPKTNEPLPGVKNIIGVSSGKGGVGKSTVACNLAVALAQQGFRVGLLDADIFGPSIPKMLGIEDEQLYMEEVDGQKLIVPAEKYGVKVLSIGFVVNKDQAVLWRGAMASNALKQLITEANWGELDYFIIDMPPGTSDISLWCRLSQSQEPSWLPHLKRWHLPTRARVCRCSWANMSTCPCLASLRTCRGSLLQHTPMRSTTSSVVTAVRTLPKRLM